MITAIKGSVAGITFQQNKSGHIVRLKPNKIGSPTSRRFFSQSSFTQAVAHWYTLVSSFRQEWNDFAALHPKSDYWGVEKVLNGYNWFVSINSNLLSLGVPMLTQPPVYTSPVIPPAFTVMNRLTGLSISFNTPVDHSDYYIFVFCSSPLSGQSCFNRRSIRLIDIISPGTTETHDLTLAFEDYYDIEWPPCATLGSFSILIGLSFVHKTSGISSSLYLVIQSIY